MEDRLKKDRPWRGEGREGLKQNFDLSGTQIAGGARTYVTAKHIHITAKCFKKSNDCLGDYLTKRC